METTSIIGSQKRRSLSLADNPAVLYGIQGLSCQYPGSSRTVLHIDQLTLHKGKLIFLLGASGAGKSTLLETLGLMNNTLSKGDVLFNARPGQPPISYRSLWQQDDQGHLASIRKQHLSFIFQETNLMDNFTAYENVCVSKMFKQGMSLGDAISGTVNLMEQVNLPLSQVGLTKTSKNLSGGQRQRLAFVRALNSPFTVLFGDEPTGNPDEANGHEFMSIIRRHVHDGGCSAIIVSHDIDLALEYADQIIVLTINPDTGVGQILPADIHNRADWKNGILGETEAFKRHIAHQYTAVKPKPQPVPVIEPQPKADQIAHAKKQTYIPLFLKKEGLALSGKRWGNFAILTLILTISFIALGFANGTLDYLQTKMQDAFVNWITVNLPFYRSGDGGKTINELTGTLNDPKLKAEFGYSDISLFSNLTLDVRSAEEGKPSSRVRGRTFEPQNDRRLLHDNIFSPANLISGDTAAFDGPNDLSVIATERILAQQGYAPDADYIYINNRTNDSAGNIITQAVPLPIRAIVRELPGQNLLGFTTSFYRAYAQRQDNPFELRNKKYIQLHLAGTEDQANALAKSLADKMNAQAYSAFIPDVSQPTEDRTTHTPGYAIRISFLGDITPEKLDEIYGQLQKQGALTAGDKSASRAFSFATMDAGLSSITYDQMSIFFSGLEKVRAFADFVFNEFNKDKSESLSSAIEVDTAKVKEKENFHFLSKVTWLISIILALFSALAVSLFILNILKSHLNKVKMNIGTFRAMGMALGESRNIYLVLVAAFVLLCTLAALLCAAAIGAGAEVLLRRTYGGDNTLQYFILFSPMTIASTAFIVVAAISIAWYTTTSILSKSPGDLIYNR